jgi:hypothetical protein
MAKPSSHSGRTIFISHAAEDGQLVRLFLELLRVGFGIPDEQIFCTVVPGQISAGEDFIENIRAHLQSHAVFMPVFSTDFQASVFCMYELGAAWALNKLMVPIILPPVTTNDLGPLLHVRQSLDITEAADLDALRNQLARYVKCNLSNAWTTCRNKFLRAAKKILECQGNWIYALRSVFEEESLRRLRANLNAQTIEELGLNTGPFIIDTIGYFRILGSRRTPNAITATGTAYRIQGERVFVRGHWWADEHLRQRDRIELFYHLESKVGVKPWHLLWPSTHTGVIKLGRQPGLMPHVGQECFSGYVHNLFESRESTPEMYAERVEMSEQQLRTLIEKEGKKTYSVLIKRIGPQNVA